MRLAPPERKKLVLLEQLATDQATITNARRLNEDEVFRLEFDNDLIYESELKALADQNQVKALVPGTRVVSFSTDSAPIDPKHHPGYYDLVFSNGATLRGNVWDTGIQDRKTLEKFGLI